MNILWITNISFPATNHLLGLSSGIGGGWMYSLAMQLKVEEGLTLAVATTYSGESLLEHTDNNIQYYLLPRQKDNTEYDQSLEAYWSKIIEEFKPAIIHIHGTEYAHGLACMRACPEQRYIVSIQGLVSVYSEYHYAGIEPIVFFKYITLNDLRRFDTVTGSKRKLIFRGKYEVEYIERTSHIIGRTSWDYSHVKALNPKVRYHFCNEILRDSFYNFPSWNIEKVKKFSIFMSQAKSQRQGLHQVLKAMSIVKAYFPGVTLRVAGMDISGGNKWVHRISTYGRYIRTLLHSLQLTGNVKFLGGLDERRMAEEFSKAHVFVCASVIENSPNSLGEAQIIGTPCIATFAGGIPDMVNDGETGLLYRFEEYKMLAFKIIEVFNNDVYAKSLSTKGNLAASTRHNREEICAKMREIYTSLI